MSPLVGITIDLLKKKAAEAVIAMIVAKAPFFAGWFVNPILGWIVPIVIDVLYDKGALGFNFLWITVENSVELSAAIKSRENLVEILKSGGNYDEAEKEFDEAADKLIRLRREHLPR
jgi:hypothetical protein